MAIRGLGSGLDILPALWLWTQALSTVVTDSRGDEAIPHAPLAPAEALASSASSDSALQRGYAAEVASPPSSIARMIVRTVGIRAALRFAPHLLLELPGIAPAGGGPGWVRLRCASDTPERLRCLERQGLILALPERLGLEPFILRDASCVARGDPACEYILHHGDPLRWAVVAATTGIALALGGAGGLTAASVLLLGGLAAAVSYGAERWRSERAARATRVVSARAFRGLVERIRPAEPSAAGSGAPSTEVSDRRPILEQEGDVWRITYEGTTIRIRHSRGMALLSHLLQNPGQELHVQALDALVPSAGAGDRTPVNPDTLPADGMSFGLGDAGPVIDDRAKADYRHRLADLRTELEDAERCNDPRRAAAARAEIEQLGDELRAATGLGGRVRRASSDADRMRIAVTRRIRAAIEQLGKLHPALGEHLEASVRTGFTCCYSPVEHPAQSR
jgi:hypothetical protein